jgi:hypothetical protein
MMPLGSSRHAGWGFSDANFSTRFTAVAQGFTVDTVRVGSAVPGAYIVRTVCTVPTVLGPAPMDSWWEISTPL